MKAFQNLKGKKVLVTGASSGIGKAAALCFAQEGADLVLTARGLEGLEATREACGKYTENVLVVPADISDSKAVHELAQKAAEFFGGRIDIWINDPGVGAVGAYDEVPMASHEQVIRTNLLGYMNGAHAVLPFFKRQQSGILINLNSLGAWLPSPYAASYAATKFGLRGFTESLRNEVRKMKGIHICDLFPGFVNSPGIRHGANYVGVELKPMLPVLSAHRIGMEVVRMAKHPRRHRMVGSISILARVSYFLAPRLSLRILARVSEYHFNHGKKVPKKEGTLFSPPSSPSNIVEDYGLKKQRRTGYLLGAAALFFTTGIFMASPHGFEATARR